MIFSVMLHNETRQPFFLSEGSIITTSSITFLDIGLIESPTDVENVINLADSSGDGVLRLGEFVVCRACAEAKLDFLTTSHKPQVLIHTIGIVLYVLGFWCFVIFLIGACVGKKGKGVRKYIRFVLSITICMLVL